MPPYVYLRNDLAISTPTVTKAFKVPDRPGAAADFEAENVLVDFACEVTVHHSINGTFVVRKGSWKLALCPGSGGWSDPRPGKVKGGFPIQLFKLSADIGEQRNLAEDNPEMVKTLASSLAKVIHDGRSTAGPKQDNDGWPNTISKPVLKLLPVLEE